MRRSGVGRLQVIAGPMFSGKSEELLRQVRRAKLAGLQVEVVNHSFDTRGGDGVVASHAGLQIPSVSVPDVAGLLAAVGERDLDLLAVDETQFFGPELVPAVVGLLVRGVNVVVAGLCVTYDARPFEPLPSLMAVAEDVVKLTAVCNVCGADAPFHQRAHDSGVGDARVPVAEHVGGAETYEARCREHLTV
ncbi:MAG TPA: thymidine kinase [Actinomycetales bacterium]|nr:thymidine kinase [Actinomycetales bacterium]